MRIHEQIRDWLWDCLNCRTPFSFSGFHIPKFRFPLNGCTYCAATKDSQLTTVKAQSPVSEALSSLSAHSWIATLKKPTQARGGLLECATFLSFTTRLL
jgi:hypothetical protein